jgi:hypothetical protein
MAERAPDKDYLDTVEDMVQSLKFGSVTIIVQDGKVIQIEKTEKLRI